MTDVEQTSKKKLNELRVIDLRQELDKRGLDRTGVKTALVDRLSKAIEQEGKNPEDYCFEIVVEKPVTKPPVKRSSRKFKEDETEATNEEVENTSEEVENTNEEAENANEEAENLIEETENINDGEETNEEKQEEDNKALSKEDAKEVEKSEESNANDSISLENAQCNGSETEEGARKPDDDIRLSPPKPETSPVLAPLTIEDVIKLDTSSKLKASDNDSMIVNPDDTQSDMDSSIHEKESVDEPMQEESDEVSNCNPATENADSQASAEEKAAEDDAMETESEKIDTSIETAKSTVETKSFKDIAKPAEDLKSVKDTAKSAENFKSSKNIVKAAEDLKNAKDTAKPAQDAKSSKDTAKPAQDSKSSKETVKPAVDSKSSKETTKSAQDSKSSKETAKPSEASKSSKELSKPTADSKAVTSKENAKKASSEKSPNKIPEIDLTEEDKNNSEAASEKNVSKTTESTKPATKRKSIDEKPPDEDDKNKKIATSKNLWVSGLAEKTRAHDLKTLFSKYGKVCTAKIVTNAKTPGARCYGFITMTSSEEAATCIEHLNNSELHGKPITVEKTTREPTGSIKRTELKAIQKSAQAKSDAKKAEDAHKSPAKGGAKTDKFKSAEKSKTGDKSKSSEREKLREDREGRRRRPISRERRSRDRSRERRHRDRRSRSRSFNRIPRFTNTRGFFRGGYNRGFGVRHFMPNRPPFDTNRFRERERSRERDLDRRRLEVIRQKEIERQNREEAIRLERERERLRIEREKLERERAEVLRLEREKQRMERERLEREKAELRKRTQMTLEERRGIKRAFEVPIKESNPFWEERKRPHREPSLEPIGGGFDFSRNRMGFNERRVEFDRSKADISPAFSSSSRRDGGKRERSPFHHRGRGARDIPDRGRPDWKGKPSRDRSFDRGDRGGNFGERSSGNRSFERPHPWEGGASDRDQNKFGGSSSNNVANSQWGPVDKPPENWGRVETSAPPQDRWSNVDRGGQTSMGHPPSIGPSQINIFGGPPSNMMNQMGNHFNPVDRFNPNMMRRF